VTPNELAKLILVSRGSRKNFKRAWAPEQR
jgi:hypothetical protein